MSINIVSHIWGNRTKKSTDDLSTHDHGFQIFYTNFPNKCTSLSSHNPSSSFFCINPNKVHNQQHPTHTMIAIKYLALVLALSTQALSACVNDPTFEWGSVTDSGNPKKNCKQIRNKEERRAAMCLISEVNAACPATCGSCCEDDAAYEFSLKKSDKLKDCVWITTNEKKKEKRFNEYCTRNNTKVKLHTWGGRTVRDACPVTCGFCHDPITVAPTPAPTTSAPTLSSAPSNQPTRPPSPQPSPFPTLKPSTSPSDSPSMVPSSAPSDTPSKAPSGTPSDVPSTVPSDSPSMVPSSAPSYSPSFNPTQSIEPSATPTATPTCADNATFTFNVKANNNEVGCVWLTRHIVNIDNERLAKYCPDVDINRECCFSCS
jgi:hypothetical protein